MPSHLLCFSVKTWFTVKSPHIHLGLPVLSVTCCCWLLRCMIHLATHTPANESVGAVGILAQEMYQLGALHTGGWSTPVCGRLDQTIPLSSVSPNGRQLMEGSGAQGEGKTSSHSCTAWPCQRDAWFWPSQLDAAACTPTVFDSKLLPHFYVQHC